MAGAPENVFMKWTFFGFYTALVFGLVVEKSRIARKRKSFWIFLGSSLTLHSCAMWYLLQRIETPRGGYFLTAVLEVVVLRGLCSLWLTCFKPSPQ
jgi:hypothetical protein